jgi:predicted Zn-dependent protease
MPGHSIQRRWKCKRLFVTACALIGAVAGCATPPPLALPITPAERVQRDRVVGGKLAPRFESQLKFKVDKELAVYLRNLAQTLADATPELHLASVGVLIVQDRGGRWRDYGLPGYRVYLSAGLIKNVMYENELAAAIAVEFAHILKQHVILRIQEEAMAGIGNQNPTDYPSIQGLLPGTAQDSKTLDYFSPTGVFAFPDEFQTAATEDAVDILYRAGFDPRGLTSLWERYESSPAHSPFEGPLLQKLQEKTRTVIAQRSPLRNPIVRSQAFLSIQKRMHKL